MENFLNGEDMLCSMPSSGRRMHHLAKRNPTVRADHQGHACQRPLNADFGHADCVPRGLPDLT